MTPHDRIWRRQAHTRLFEGLVENGLRLSYALRRAKDNPEMESFIGRFKVENHSLFLDARTIDELRGVVEKRMKYYNREQRHSSLGNRAPFAFTDARHHGGLESTIRTVSCEATWI